MKTSAAITLVFSIVFALLNQSCCNKVACDVPPIPKIIIVVSMDSLGNGFTSSEFDSMIIIKRTFLAEQETIDTLNNDSWYYSSHSEHPDYPRYDLELWMMEGDHFIEYELTDQLGSKYLIDNLSLGFHTPKSGCCRFAYLTSMHFQVNGKVIETSDYYYSLLIEK